ncbi:2-C-methyl-D-erythritol 4-phosphate cytidylyltransferase [Thermococcus sp.]|uniref:IspD/TarI family cytidylyltransferase n=1 Tax=Thermococcus sp. TaxID=35749 RepID=UPI00261B5F1E|nr:2-C-methyl-D-erythritol 4-phosphate cytidylyltransferase [Thermococcus sp.]
MTTLILLAGGIGKRANLGLPKQYFKIEEKMIIEYTLENVSEVDSIDNIVLVSNPGFMKTGKKLMESFPKISTVTEGGTTRNESMYRGFLKISEGERKVIVHDAVRPFTPPWVFERMEKLLERKNVVTTVNPITGNLIELKNGRVYEIHDRSKYVMGESPTGYRYRALKETLETAVSGGYLNEIPHDILLAIKAGFDVHALHCNCFNLKITFREDVKIAKALIRILEERG